MYIVGVDDQGKVILRLEDSNGLTLTMAMDEADVRRLVKLLEANLQLVKETS